MDKLPKNERVALEFVEKHYKTVLAWFGGAVAFLGLVIAGVVLCQNLVSESKLDKFSMLESDFSEYKTFREKIDGLYPYYEPDGFTYKETIGRLFKEKEVEAQVLYDAIQANIPDVIEWERADGSTFMQAPTNFDVKEDFQKFHALFPQYRETVCNLRTEAWLGGSGSSVGVTLCEIYETEKYIELLKKYHKDVSVSI